MKNKECFPTYESARFAYDNNIVPNFGATRLECGFGRWLWRDMDKAGILTQAGRKMLARAEKEAAR